jgi:hypothetical protein
MRNSMVVFCVMLLLVMVAPGRADAGPIYNEVEFFNLTHLKIVEDL